MGWKQVNGDWYYYGTDNQPYKGWRNLGTAEGEKIPHWSFFDKNTGKLYVGWHKIGANEGETTPHWSYFGNNGWLRTGWNLLTVKHDKEAAESSPHLPRCLRVSARTPRPSTTLPRVPALPAGEHPISGRTDPRVPEL